MYICIFMYIYTLIYIYIYIHIYIPFTRSDCKLNICLLLPLFAAIRCSAALRHASGGLRYGGESSQKTRKRLLIEKYIRDEQSKKDKITTEKKRECTK